MAPLGALARRRSVVAGGPPLALAALAVFAGFAFASPGSSAQAPPTIDQVKPSVVAIGTFQTTRVPQFRFLGTGFAVGDGTLAATNAHVIPASLEPGADPELLVALLPGTDPSRVGVRRAHPGGARQRTRCCPDEDGGSAAAAAEAARLGGVAEGDSLLFTGFPIGGVLGLFPATHRAMVAAIAPVAMPSPSGRQLDPKVVRRIRDAPFSVFQLDATAFPGNSGSPLYDPRTAKWSAFSTWSS